MKLISFLAIAAVLSTATAAASAEPRLNPGASKARLATPLSDPVEKLIDGRFWSCAGDTCVANAQDGADSQPLWMECSHAASEFGAFAAYQTGANTLEPAKLIRCNARAKGAPRG